MNNGTGLPPPDILDNYWLQALYINGVKKAMRLYHTQAPIVLTSCVLDTILAYIVFISCSLTSKWSLLLRQIIYPEDNY